jgi:hypothetical protein
VNERAKVFTNSIQVGEDLRVQAGVPPQSKVPPQPESENQEFPYLPLLTPLYSTACIALYIFSAAAKLTAAKQTIVFTQAKNIVEIRHTLIEEFSDEAYAFHTNIGHS